MGPKAKRKRRKCKSSKITVRHADGSVEVVPPHHFQPRKNRMWYIRTDHWKALRREARKRDGNRCVECGATERLEVHHLTYERIGRERLEDVVTLCQPCHAEADRQRRAAA